jgi:hypothetical protein
MSLYMRNVVGVIIFLLAIFLAIISIMIYNSVSSDTGEIESQEFDFGQARLGQVIEHVFTVKNPFSKPLYIEKVTSSCSCTVIGKTPKSIPPRSVNFLCKYS